MPKIIIDGKQVECRPGISVLQAALEAGFNVPHYCYHPGLSVVASCRLCLMEMKMPHPQTREMGWAPKLFPSCQTPVKDAMEVRFDSEKVRENQRHVMEYYLLNHPLDCPVCDKAGECYLQDYSEQFGNATSRMVEDKHKNPKKDIGPHTLLYQDRCVLCTRCVRFCDEIAGAGELAVVNRGNRGEIDVFPGVPLANELQGNVVDLCPVGALLDKDFLFKQRVWLLKSAKSVSPADSRGSTIWIDYNNQGIHRIRPRFNPQVNEWWISDEARFGWKYINSDKRLNEPRVRRLGSEISNLKYESWQPIRWEELPKLLRSRFEEIAAADQGASVAAVLSPMMSCEEALLLARFIRGVAPQATLVLGYVPVDGEDKTFPKGFAIKAEKCPNRRGVEEILKHFGGKTMGFEEFVTAAGDGVFKAAYVVGGYPKEWVTENHHKPISRIEFLVTHDLFSSRLDATATVQIPSASFAEREGSFMNCDGLLQPFERAIPPLEGVKADGQFFYELAGESGLFRAQKVREAAAAELPALQKLHIPPDPPKHAH
jgi:NADH-quinone oxidoreductase subunit G